jgi:TonB family protein
MRDWSGGSAAPDSAPASAPPEAAIAGKSAVGASGAGVGGGRRIKVGGPVAPPLQLVRADPVYPEEARAAGIEGVVLLELVIGEDGTVIDIDVVRSIPELDQSAIDAASQWEYEPTLLNGEPVEVEIIVSIRFALP